MIFDMAFPDAWLYSKGESEIQILFAWKRQQKKLPDVNRVNSTIETGTGENTSLYIPPFVGSPNCWKTMTYQLNGRFASEFPMPLIFGQFPFYGANTYILMPPSGAPNTITLYVHTQLRAVTSTSVPYHTTGQLQITANANQFSLSPLLMNVTYGIRAFYADNTPLRLMLTQPIRLSDVVYPAVDANGFLVKQNGVLNVYYYVPPSSALKLDPLAGGQPYIRYEFYSRVSPALTAGTTVVVNGHLSV
jgi:hypothetical protein